MKEITLSEAVLTAFQQRLRKELQGRQAVCVHTCNDVFVHATTQGDMAYMANRYALGSGEISLNSLKRGLEVDEGVNSVVGFLVNSMVKTVLHHVEAVDEGDGVVIYFAPKNEEKEKFATEIYTDLYLCEEDGKQYPAVVVESFFLVAPVGSPIVNYPLVEA